MSMPVLHMKTVLLGASVTASAASVVAERYDWTATGMLFMGIAATFLVTWFWRHRDADLTFHRESEIRIRGVETFVARQDEINGNLRIDMGDIKSTVQDIHHMLIRGGTRSGEDGVIPHGHRNDDRRDP
jgi:hypothetical protein